MSHHEDMLFSNMVTKEYTKRINSESQRGVTSKEAGSGKGSWETVVRVDPFRFNMCCKTNYMKKKKLTNFLFRGLGLAELLNTATNTWRIPKTNTKACSPTWKCVGGTQEYKELRRCCN